MSTKRMSNMVLQYPLRQWTDAHPSYKAVTPYLCWLYPCWQFFILIVPLPAEPIPRQRTTSRWKPAVCILSIGPKS
jgi:hypothetical protein